MPNMLTGPTLRALRNLRGLSQADLAKKSGIAANAIANFETGKRDIRIATATKLLRALGVSVTYAIDGMTLSGP